MLAEKISTRGRAALVCVFGIYAVLAVAVAYSKAPWLDEAIYGFPGASLAQRGYMGTPILDETSTTWKGVRLDGINHHTYWATPLYPLTWAAFGSVAGFGIYQQRFLGIVCGIIVLACWFYIVCHFSDERTALVATAILASDYLFINRGGDGRPDMFAAALAGCTLAAYLRLRETGLMRAVLVSSTFAVGAGFAHPNGGAFAFLGLALFAIFLDGRALRISHLAVAALPLLVAGAAWGVYILQDPADFRAQLFANAGYRLNGILSPLAALRSEWADRYAPQFGFGWWSRGAARSLVIIPALWFAATATAVVLARRYPRIRVLVILTALQLAYMTLFEGVKTPLYFVHVVPLFSAMLAFAAMWFWSWNRAARAAVVMAAVALTGIQLMRTVKSIYADQHHKNYLPAVAFLKPLVPEYLVFGSAELGYSFGFTSHLVDDIWLGFRSGKRPDLVVMDVARYQDGFTMMASQDPEKHRFVTDILHKYQAVFECPGYTIYARPDLPIRVAAR